jgi:flagellar basal body-associated protein FliL
MAKPIDEPKQMTQLQERRVVITAILTSVVAVSVAIGILIASYYFLPAPWYLLGTIPATCIMWLLNRETIVEIFVTFLVIMATFWIFGSAIPAAKEAIELKQKAKALNAAEAVNKVPK